MLLMSEKSMVPSIVNGLLEVVYRENLSNFILLSDMTNGLFSKKNLAPYCVVMIYVESNLRLPLSCGFNMLPLMVISPFIFPPNLMKSSGINGLAIVKGKSVTDTS